MNTKFLRIFLSTLVVTALSVFTKVNAQNYKWAIKGSGTGTEVIYAVASDIFGNTVVTGQFNSSTMKIGNGTTTLTLTNSNSGKYDVFVVKLNSSGTPLWAKSEGGPGDDGGTAIKLDDSGNVYVAGSFQSTSTSTGPSVFGTKNLYSAGSNDIFIAKYDYLGNLVWVKSGGGSTYDIATGIAIDRKYNVYVTGNITSTSGTIAGKSIGSIGGPDGFLAKYDINGNGKYAKIEAKSTSEENITGITIDSSQNLFITGRFSTTSATVAGKSLSSAGVSDFFIAKLDTAGNGIWAKSEGGTGDDRGLAVTSGMNSDLYVTGYFNSSFTWGSTSISSNGGTDFYAAKYDSSGSFKWIYTSGSTSDDKGYGVAIDLFNNIYFTGSYQSGGSGTAFNGASSTKKTISSNGAEDAFLVRYDATGKIIWATGGGSSGTDIGYGTALDFSGNIWMGGEISGNSTFGSQSIKGVSGIDAFLTRIYDNSSINPVVTVTGSSTICSGDSVLLSTVYNSNYNYQWKLGGSGISNANNNYYYAKTTGTYTVTITDPSGTTGTSSGTSITVNTSPNVTLSYGSTTLCNGDTSQLSVPNVFGNTYQWYVGSTAISGATKYNYYAKSTGSYFVTVSNSKCTKSSLVVPVTVNPVPTATIKIIGKAQVCSNDSVHFSTTPGSGYTYQWYIDGSKIAKATDTVYYAKTNNTHAYKVVVTNSFSCSATSTILNGTVDSPLRNRTGLSKTFCSGSTGVVGLNKINGYLYKWTSNPKGLTSTYWRPTVSPTVNTWYILMATDSVTGCTRTDSVQFFVTPIPAAKTIANTTICSGTTISIGSTAVSGNTYSWTSSPTGFTSTSSNPSVSPTSTTTYNLLETISSTGCINKNSVTITVNPTPSKPSLTSNSPLCAGNTLNLFSTSYSGATYAWTGPNSFSATTQNTTRTKITTADSGYYKMTVKVSGCTNSDSIKVKVNALPIASHVASQNICNGNSLSIGGASVSGSTYTWTSNPSGFTSTSANPSVSPTVNTTYYITEKNSAGCSFTDSLKLTVVAKPSAPTCSSNSPLCAGSTLNLKASSITGASYSWTGPNSYTNGTQNPSIINVSSSNAGTYYCTVTVSGCTSTSSGSTTVTINPLPTPSAGTSKSICLGGSASIGMTAVTGHTYSWTSKPSGYSSSSSSVTVSPTSTTTYYLTETITSTGCNKTDSVIITVNPLPTKSAGADASICTGSSTSIGSTTVTGVTYSWSSSPSGFTSTSANPSVNPTSTTTYYLTNTMTSTGCSNKDTVVITVNPLPSKSAGPDASICKGSSTSIGATAVTGVNYSWTSSPSGFTSTSANPSVSPTTTTS